MAYNTIMSCYQCRKCSSGCPVASIMEIKPNEIIRRMQLGHIDKLLGANSIWLCINCKTCGERCPNNIDISYSINQLRRSAWENNQISVPEVANFHEVFTEMIMKYGRNDEVEMLFNYKKKTKNYTKDIKLGLNLIMRGKFKLSVNKGNNEIGKILKLVRGQ